ncbi:RNA polymerase sigma factor WhiG [Cellulomonas chengniuliangii]|uniref:RNA polymerase sigma factor n=1 Tax=Cellulomonas chengniuliangii TaxID=2968084 RepID=A0ABY5L0Q9_9CELL|nr:RNA polymerase sigma factor WhiG [Cellulomonas chengniuliangii]MCC2309057.1 RNA polymerase sigma factor WhiG [Cellulomonas chengniuliangii]MCC2319201.1 RNA polymerase sigma factor WhiG [Cellulomonas chengniuliangii]MCC2319304.1 RNA polymerase sigma factor WhiG [Cellulomonas chengniuliangii]UUI74213.1 RNA polymerase sigma factor WhiG [Cellulomonas chengniuliangii]
MTAQAESVVLLATRARSAVTAPEGVVPQPHAAGVEASGAFPHQRRLDVVRPADDSDAYGSLATDADEIELAWIEFKAGGDRLVRERLILHYGPLVTAVASRVGMRLPSTVEQADLVSYGMFGLIDAIEKYELDRAVKFETYASARIRGAILDELRAMDWIPRSVRTKARAVDRAYAELESELHRTPTESEVAQRLEVGVGELRSVFTQLSTVNVAALDELLGAGYERTDKFSLIDTLGDDRAQDPAGSFEAQETKFLLARAIEQLGEREKIVLVLYYYEGMTLAEIGRVLGVTESRISQMHTAAMLRLRAKLTESERS